MAKHKKLYIAVSIILAFLVLTMVTYEIWLEAIAKFLIVRDDLSKSDVIVVLGGGGPDRILHGIELYKSGYAPLIIITGMKHNLPGLTATWPELAMREAVSLGVPEEAIMLEERPTSTYEDAVYTKEDMLDRNLKSAIVVSSPDHTRRSRMIFRKVFEDQPEISLLFSPVENSDFQVHKWWTRERELIGVVNEYCKLVLYLFKYIV